MPTPNINVLEQKRDDIRASLDSLKAATTQAEKERLQKQADQQIKDFYKEISNIHAENATEQGKLDALKTEVDGYKQEVTKLLEQTRDNLAALQEQAQTNQQTPTQAPSQAPTQTPTQAPTQSQTPENQPAEQKGFWWKTKDFISENWEAATSWQKWKEEPGTNLVRWGALLGTGVAVWIWVKKLWNWAFWDKKKEKESNEWNSDSWESKSFWKTGWWKFLKWSGLWAWAYYVVHGLKTGKWGLWYLFDWKENSPTSTKWELYDNYTELAEKDPEKYKEYEKFGTNVNTMYDSIWEREKKYFWSDSQIVLWEIWDRAKEEKIQKAESSKNIDTRWLVPYSLDNYYANVWELLSYWWVSKYLRAKNIEEYKQKITGFGAEWFDKTMVPFLSSFASFSTFWILSTDTAQQKMDKFFNWIRDNADDNMQILDLFFRQYTKVLTYMADKKNALAAKKAREIISRQWYDGKAWPSDPDEQEEMINEAINDSEWIDKNLKSTSYWAFMSSSILWASKILEQETLNQSEMTDELKDVVDEVDSQTEKLIWWFDNNAFTKAEAKLNAWSSLEMSEKEWLKKVADNIIDDLWDTQEWGWLYDTFDYWFELLGLSEADRQTILKESWITDALTKTATSIQSLQNEVFTNPTKENVAQLKKLVGEYTSMKKEIAVALYAIQEAKENKDAGDTVAQVLWAMGTGFSHFLGSMNDLIHRRADTWDIINIFIWLTISGGIVEFWWRLSWKKWAIVAGHYSRKVGLAPLALAEMGLWHTRWWWAVKRRIKDLSKVNRAWAENLLKKKVIEWVLSPRQVKDIVTNDPEIMRKIVVTSADTKEQIFKKFVTNLFEGSQEQANLFIKYYGKTKGLVSWTRASVRDWWLTSHAHNIEINTAAFDELKKFDIEIEKLGGWSAQRKFFDRMIKKANWVDDLSFLNKLINNNEFKTALTQDSVKQLRKLSIAEFKTLESNGNLAKFLKNELPLDTMIRELKWTKKVAQEVVEEAVEVADTPARRAFNAGIDRALWKFDEFADKRPFEYTINKLKALKKDATLADEEMEIFAKFIDNWFHPKFIPELKKLFDIKAKVWAGDAAEEMGTRLKRLLADGNFSEFNGYLRNPDFWKMFKNAQIDNVLELSENLKKTFSKFWSLASQATKNAMKNVMKVILKVF